MEKSRLNYVKIKGVRIWGEKKINYSLWSSWYFFDNNSSILGVILKTPEVSVVQITTCVNKKNIGQLEDILKPTNGIVIYQEQIMQIARTMADYTLGEADMLRKAMSKKKKDTPKKPKTATTKSGSGFQLLYFQK